MALEQQTALDPMQAFFEETEAKNLHPLWRGSQPWRDQPYGPHIWRWSDLEPFIERACELVRPGPSAYRRVLNMTNPGVGGATHSLTAGLQIVMPGEIAPSHRHTAAAIRFIIQGSGTVTMVNGEPCLMEPGDLVLTPGWTWHGH